MSFTNDVTIEPNAAPMIMLTAEATAEAMQQCKAAGMKAFLTKRADAFLSNDYYDSDIAWMELQGIIEPTIGADGQVTVDMGAPVFRAADVPFLDGTGAIVEPLEIDGATVMVSVLSLGNPHAVQIVGDTATAPVATQGPRIEMHPRFPRRVNAGYMQVVDRANIRLRVWERGAGETLACGTGACAAVAAGIARGLLDSKVRVETRGGALDIEWPGRDKDVMMTGPAVAVFEGVWRASDR